MYKWQFRLIDSQTDFSPDFVVALRDAFVNSLGLASYSTEDIQHRLKECQLLGTLEDEAGTIQGCVMVTIPQTPLDGKYLVWGNGGYLTKVAQKRVVWRQILDKIQLCYPEKTFGWIGCRTQNPMMMRSYGLFGQLYPFETDYSETEGQRLMDYMLENIVHVKEVAGLDRANGICHSLYQGYNIGRLGDYPVNINGKLERQLNSWGFNADQGDALIVVAKLPLARQNFLANQKIYAQTIKSKIEVAEPVMV